MQVDMSGEEDAFQQTATAGLNTLVLGLETRLDAGLQQMVRMPWATIEAVRMSSLFWHSPQMALLMSCHCDAHFNLS